jgi:hypothetical protein
MLDGHANLSVFITFQQSANFPEFLNYSGFLSADECSFLRDDLSRDQHPTQFLALVL